MLINEVGVIPEINLKIGRRASIFQDVFGSFIAVNPNLMFERGIFDRDQFPLFLLGDMFWSWGPITLPWDLQGC